MHKHLIIVLFFSSILVSCNHSQQTKTENKKIASTYFLPVPLNWTTETFPFPISFAPSITYKGTEDIRFAPGWGNASSNEYWTYAFLWNVEGKQAIDTATIKKYLTDYYSGLINSNIEKRKILKSILFPPVIVIEKATIENEDAATYNGTVHMLDYQAQEPITLNCIIHVRSCPNTDNTFIFHEISPKPYSDPVWKTMNDIWTDFKCAGNDK